MKPEKIEKVVNEICNVGKLEKYREVLRQIIVRIANEGCRVFTRYDIAQSSSDYSVETGNTIRVSLVAVDEPLDIIWKLLHEYGHVLSGERNPTDSDVQREELAWHFADKLVREYSDLNPFIDSYLRCRNYCLATYYKKYGKV